MTSATSLKISAGVVVVLLAAILAVCVVTVVEVFEIKAGQVQSPVRAWPNRSELSPNPNSSMGILPPPPPFLPNTNVNPPTHSSKYEEIAALLRRSIDTSVNPCDDFYKYTCGRYEETSTADTIKSTILDRMAPVLESIKDDDLLPIKQMKLFYKTCVNAHEKMSEITADGARIKNKMKEYFDQTKAPFPLIDGTAPNWPDPKALGSLVGTLKLKFGVEILLRTLVLDNGHLLRGSQPTLSMRTAIFIFDPSKYTKGDWSTSKQELTDIVANLFEAYASLQQLQLNKAELTRAAEEVVEFDRWLATLPSSEDTFIRVENFLREYTFLHWPSYVDALLELNKVEVREFMRNATIKIEFLGTNKFPYLNKGFRDGFNGTGITPATLYNYFAFHVLYKNRDFFPAKTNVQVQSEINSANVTCFKMLKLSMFLPMERLFLDTMYPDKTERNRLRAALQRMVDHVLVGAESMINEISWLTPASRTSALSKIHNVLMFVGYSESLDDDQFLTKAYAGFSLTPNQSYFDMLDTITAFAVKTDFDLLTLKEFLFFGSNEVNSWYSTEQNAITITLAYARRPYFDPDWPASVNFAGIGAIMGHELGHAFDRGGVQYDAFGKNQPWLDSPSRENFLNMTKCLERQYSKFCPLDPNEYSPNCVNGTYTLADNVADNFGIRAAFRAYRNVIGVNGVEPRLPGDLMAQFTHDQLFFLATAYGWCEKKSDAKMQKALMEDHSPSMYRLLGSIANFPAFRNAFNCPVGSNSAPEQHCNVWIGDITADKPFS